MIFVSTLVFLMVPLLSWSLETKHHPSKLFLLTNGQQSGKKSFLSYKAYNWCFFFVSFFSVLVGSWLIMWSQIQMSHDRSNFWKWRHKPCVNICQISEFLEVMVSEVGVLPFYGQVNKLYGRLRLKTFLVWCRPWKFS